MFASVGQFAFFSCQATIEAVQAPLRRFEEFFSQLYRALIGALPLAFVAGIVLGAVIYLHTSNVLSRSGTTEFLPTALSVAVLLELAPIGAGLIVAARSGASLGAEIASLKQSEQLDAIAMLGLSPMREMIGPRVAATVITMPILHVFIAMLAIGTGYIADWYLNEGTWLRYQQAALEELYLREVIPAGAKTIVFGWLISLAGCFAGLRANPGTDGVGDAATQGVVFACLFVFVSDLILVTLIQWIIGPI